MNGPLTTLCFSLCGFELHFFNGLLINYAYLAYDWSKITEKEHLRDLSVTTSYNAAFQDHISNAHSMEDTCHPNLKTTVFGCRVRELKLLSELSRVFNEH